MKVPLLRKFDLRILVTILILLISLGFSYLLPVAQKTREVQRNYPAQACPALSAAGSNFAYLPASKLGVRGIDGKSTKFAITSRTVVSLGSSALLIDSNPGASLTYSTSPASGIAATMCSPGIPDQWFVGGSGGLTSKGAIDLVNSGLSDSIVDLHPFTSKGELRVIPVKVRANSSATVRLDALAPGDDAMAVHVVTRTGRVSTFVLDQRAKGLSKLGMDYVKPSDSPRTQLFLTGIYPHNGNKSSVQNTLRLLAPGSLDATIHVQVISGDGSFVPVGFDGMTLKHGVVSNIPLTNLTTTTAFGLQIDSDQPILAGALTTIGSKDFAWSAPVSEFESTSMNFGGNTPLITFIGSKISVNISGLYSNGRRFSQRISGSEIAFWAPKLGVNAVHFTVRVHSGIYAGALITLSGGLTYFPIAPGASIENTALPFNDVHTLTH